MDTSGGHGAKLSPVVSIQANKKLPVLLCTRPIQTKPKSEKKKQNKDMPKT